MPVKKDIGWKEDLTVMVREGKTYQECETTLKEKYGEKGGAVGASTYGKMKKLAFPDEKAEKVLTEVGDARREVKKRQFKLPPWSPQKQTAADKSQLADVLNQVIFLSMPCPSGQLEFKHVQEINLGGGIVGSVQYMFPNIDLGNPILVLVLRVGLLVVKVRKLCYMMKDKVGGVKAKYRMPAKPEETPEGADLKDKSEHPTDIFMREHGLFTKKEGKEDVK
jgi:hypothetical protein